MNDEEAVMLINEMAETIIQERFQYTHKWQKDSAKSLVATVDEEFPTTDTHRCHVGIRTPLLVQKNTT